MKKMKYLALMSAIALTSAVGFTACSSSDEISENNPVIDKKDYGKGVTTQFALNIGSASSTTRSTANVAQDNNHNFRGMEDIYLIPMNFAQTPTNTTTPFSETGANPYITTIYHLGNIPNTSAMAQLDGEVYKKIYSLTLPVGTNNFLFYGRATHESKQSGDGLPNDGEALNGKLTMTTISEGTAKAGDISITLNAIDATASTDAGSPRKYLADMLTDIATTSATVGTTTTYWKNLDNTKNKNKTLLDTYSKFTSVKDGELRAGSAEAIRATIQELYRTVLAQERYGEDDEVKKVAKAIREKIHKYFDVYFAALTATTPFSGTAVASDAVNAQTGTDPGIYDYDLNYYMPYLKLNSTNIAIYNFPTYQGLPSGVVNLECTQTTNGCDFSYKTTSTAVLSTGNDVTNFTFPAELTYFANSALRASNYSKEANEYPTTGGWDDNTQWDVETETGTKDWDNTEVTADTRAVAMKNKIFYGVSRLQSNVKLGFDPNTVLKDNREHLFNDGETVDQSITINEKSFILTGILVGQQPDAVGWNFLTKDDDKFNKVVYDRILPTGVNTYYTYPEYPTNAYNLSAGSYNFVTKDGTSDNYTLLLDNYTGSSTGQAQEVSVALEFINNTGKDFYGRENVIPAGGTFYLVGKLKLAGTADIDFDSQYGTANPDYAERIPGFDVKRVFIQDHTTVARFKIGTDALKKAYNTVPDLRTVQMLFGLTVDMEWRTGITYPDVPLNQ